jgi:hypothetical protein
MSHCTKFDFKYSSEEAIVKAFKKMKVKCSTEMICEFKSDFSKKILGKLGYVGKKQYRAICGTVGSYNIFLCKIAENDYELMIERATVSSSDEKKMTKIADDFRRAYMEVAVDEIVKKLDKGNMPSKVEKQKDKFIVNFGVSLEYSVVVAFENGQITEEVIGVKGDFCTKLTEDIENILSHPTAELATEWKAEYTMQIEDQNIQVLSLSF